MINVYDKLEKLQVFSEELIKLQESISSFDNDISISKKNIEAENRKILDLSSKKNDSIAKIKVLNRKINLIKNEIEDSKKGQKSCVGYVRTSTTKRYERQYHTIYNSSFNIVEVFKETVSAYNTELSKRVLCECIDYCFQNGIGYIIVSEASRLSRNTILFKDICDKLIENHVNVYSCSENLYLFDDNFNINEEFHNKILYSEKECEMIRDRNYQGYKEFISKGGKVGRKDGYKKPIEKYEEEYSKELALLRQGLSLHKVSRITGTAINTVKKVKKLFNISI